MTNTMQEISLGQFVRQLAALLQKEDVDLPLKKQDAWHLLFYNLKNVPPDVSKPEFLDDLVFDWDATYPKCQELSDFLNAMHFTANVSARNPRFDVIMVEPTVADRWSQQLDQSDPELRAFFDTAAELAREEFAL